MGQTLWSCWSHQYRPFGQKADASSSNPFSNIFRLVCSRGGLGSRPHTPGSSTWVILFIWKRRISFVCVAYLFPLSPRYSQPLWVESDYYPSHYKSEDTESWRLDTSLRSHSIGAWNQIICLHSIMRQAHPQCLLCKTLRPLPPCCGLCSPVGISSSLVAVSTHLGPASSSSLLSLASPTSSLPLQGPENTSWGRETGPQSLLTMAPPNPWRGCSLLLLALVMAGVIYCQMNVFPNKTENEK